MLEALKGLSPGRIVHYVLPEGNIGKGEHRPAIVTKVWADPVTTHNVPDLVVFKSANTDGGVYQADTFRAPSVPYDPEGKPGTWHWPERMATLGG